MQSSISGTKQPFNIREFRKYASHFRKLMLIFPFIHPAAIHGIIVKNKFNWELIMQLLSEGHKIISVQYGQNVDEQINEELAKQSCGAQRMWNKSWEIEVKQQNEHQISMVIEPGEQEYADRGMWIIQDGNKWVKKRSGRQYWINHELIDQEFVQRCRQNHQADCNLGLVTQNGGYNGTTVNNVISQQQCPQLHEQNTGTGNPLITPGTQNREQPWMNIGQREQGLNQQNVQIKPIYYKMGIGNFPQNGGQNLQNMNRMTINNKTQRYRKRKYTGILVEGLQSEMDDSNQQTEFQNKGKTMEIKARKRRSQVQQTVNEKKKVETKTNGQETGTMIMNQISEKGKATSNTRIKSSKKEIYNS